MDSKSVDRINENRKKKLKTFITWLEKELDCSFNIKESFNDRILLQKYVYLARFFGLDLPYNDYDVYLRGPYSSRLADDYYSNLEDFDLDASYFKEFNKEEFLDTIKEKDIEWLEIASTLKSLYTKYKNHYKEDKLARFLVNKTSTMKSKDKEKVKDIFKSLKDNSLI